MSHTLNSNLEQWLFTILKKRWQEGKRSTNMNRIITSLQTGNTSFTQEAFEEILEHLKDEFEIKIDYQRRFP